MEKATLGLWTPWALVLCYKCHGFVFDRQRMTPEGKYESYKYTLSEFEQKRVTTPLPIEENKAVTFCDKCGTDIQVYDTVAAEHNMVKKLRELGIDAKMQQTGGMNSACEVTKKFMGPLEEHQYPPHYLAVYDWDGDGLWCIGGYDENSDWIEDEGVGFSSEAGVLNFFQEADNVKTIVGDDNV